MRYLALAVAFILAALPARADEPAIEGVIGSQLQAFEADDFDTAFTYASPMIQGMFRTPGNFGAMVSRGYPMVHRPGDIQYLELEDFGTVKRQRVMIRDDAGVFHVLDYDMIEVDGAWRINGVRLVPTAQVGV